MGVELDQGTADAMAAAWQGQFTATATNKIHIKDGSGTTLASATDVAVAVTSNIISISSAGGLSVATSGAAEQFELTDASDVALVSGSNSTLSIPPGDQNTTDNTFTLTAHGLTKNQVVIIGGDIPTTDPAVSDGDAVYVTEVAANTFKIARSPGGAPVGVTAAASGSTTFQTQTAVGASDSGAVIEISSGTALIAGESVSINSLNFTVPLQLISNQ